MALKIGMIGTNFISDDFCEAAAQVPGAELFAVYSRKQETGDAFAAKHNIPRVYTDYDEFLDSGLDAVYVASPNFAHCSQTLKALDHKKHVLCEKVMAVNEQEVRSMIDCARQNNAVLLEAMRPDFDPAYDLIEQNLPRIGKLRRATFEFCQYSSRYDSFREGIIQNAYDSFREGIIQNAFNPELGNAAVMDIGVYCIHSLVRLFGAPKGVKAFSTKLPNGFDGSGTHCGKGGDNATRLYGGHIEVKRPAAIQETPEARAAFVRYYARTNSFMAKALRRIKRTLKGDFGA